MVESSLAKRRYEEFWQDFKLRDAAEGCEEGEISSVTLPDTVQQLQATAIDPVEAEFKDFWEGLKATRKLKDDDLELLRETPAANARTYLAVVDDDLEEQLKVYFEETKNRAMDELKGEKRKIAEEIAEEFIDLKARKLGEDREFAVYYHTYPLWTYHGLSPDDTDKKWELVKLLRKRNLANPKAVDSFLQPDYNPKKSFSQRESVLQGWISEESIKRAGRIYSAQLILGGPRELKNSLLKFLKR